MKNIFPSKEQANKRRLLVVLGVLFIAILILSFWGVAIDHTASCANKVGACTGPLVWIDHVVTVLQFFTLNESIELAGGDNWQLTIARLLAALFAILGILTIVWRIFQDELNQFRLSRYRNHIIIAGWSDYARFFAESCIKSGNKKIVFVDEDKDGSIAAFCKLHSFHFLNAKATDPCTLRAVNLSKAQQLIIAGTHDDINIETCHEAQAYLEKRNEKLSETIVIVKNIRVVEELEHDNTFMKTMENRLDLIFFNQARMTARILLDEAVFAGQALDRKQKRIHLILFGLTETTIEVAIEFLRLSPCLHLAKPRLDWFVSDIKSLQGCMLNRNEAFGHLLFGQDNKKIEAPLSWAIEMHTHQLVKSAMIPSLEEIEHIADATGNEITAIIIAHEDVTDSVTTALSINDRLFRSQFWKSPTYVHVPHHTPLEKLFKVYRVPFGNKIPSYLDKLEMTDNPNDVVQPFGALISLCNLMRLQDQREGLAKEIHDAYIKKREEDRQKGDASVDRDKSMVPWNDLPNTYKAANRRAADHFKVKLASCLKTIPQPDKNRLPLSALDDPLLFEALAELEHDSWRIDRELDGWRPGERDNNLKLHPDLKSYEELEPKVKEFDRAQIRFVTTRHE